MQLHTMIILRYIDSCFMHITLFSGIQMYKMSKRTLKGISFSMELLTLDMD